MVNVTKKKQGKESKKRMESRVEEVEGSEYLILTEGDRMHMIDLRALSSWGILLGLTDEAEIVKAILRFQDTPVKAGEPNVWTPMYEALGEGLDAMSASGVPPEFMEDCLDPALGSPVPGPAVVAKVEQARANGRAKIEQAPDVLGDAAADVAAVLADHGQKIADARVAFVDDLAPLYELPPAPVDPAATAVITPGVLA